MTTATKRQLRSETHEFGPWTVEVWECDNGQIALQASIFGAVVMFRKRDESFDEVKKTTKEILIDAARRYQWAATNWDQTQTSTRP